MRAANEKLIYNEYDYIHPPLTHSACCAVLAVPIYNTTSLLINRAHNRVPTIALRTHAVMVSRWSSTNYM